MYGVLMMHLNVGKRAKIAMSNEFKKSLLHFSS
jgi:hypothetical protein